MSATSKHVLHNPTRTLIFRGAAVPRFLPSPCPCVGNYDFDKVFSCRTRIQKNVGFHCSRARPTKSRAQTEKKQGRPQARIPKAEPLVHAADGSPRRRTRRPRQDGISFPPPIWPLFSTPDFAHSFDVPLSKQHHTNRLHAGMLVTATLLGAFISAPDR